MYALSLSGRLYVHTCVCTCVLYCADSGDGGCARAWISSDIIWETIMEKVVVATAGILFAIVAVDASSVRRMLLQQIVWKRLNVSIVEMDKSILL